MDESAGYPAPAKLNLFLRVVGRRPDGYHELQSLFVLVNFGDTVRLTVREDGVVRHVQPLAGIPEAQELTYRAAKLLQTHTGCRLGADIEVVKRTPQGAGLGGGSSDAATALIVLNRLWNTGLSRRELQELGLKLGADVPFFVFGQSAFAEGVGEALQAVATERFWYVVLTPPIQVPTAEIFQAPDLTRNSQRVKIADFSAHGRLDDPSGGTAGKTPGEGPPSWWQLGNDLEPVACRKYPVIREYLEWLSGHGLARMTGSGSSVFAAFSSRDKALAVFAARPPGYAGFVAEGLDRHPLYHWLPE